jgi:hypothetical protein
MARYDDRSPYVERWTNQGLITALRDKVNFVSAGFNLPSAFVDENHTRSDTDMIREATRLYRETWVNPIIDEIERRLVR